MTRECVSDFDGMKKYIEMYSISQNLLHPGYISSLKNMHRCYFAAISWNGILRDDFYKFQLKYPDSTEEIIFRLSESVSDLGSSFFNWINGNYKASRVMLRVSIENFIKAISALEDKSQLVEKNLFKLFEVASNQRIFNNPNNPLVKKLYQSLHCDYGVLCADVHTATDKNMEKLTSLADFPAFDLARSDSASNLYIQVSKNINSIFCIIFNEFFHEMHHRDKENLLFSIPKKVKPYINLPIK